MTTEAHWEKVYGTKADDDVSWYESSPDLSLKLIRETLAKGARSVIDVGGGTSRLIEALLSENLDRLAVLDLSVTALERAKERLGAGADRVEWIAGDVSGISDVGPFDVWHDRALFHFLTSDEKRKQYVKLLEKTVTSKGFVVIATFGPEGPETCSGLPVERYDAAALRGELGQAFDLREAQIVDHLTPHGRHQQFMYAVFARA